MGINNWGERLWFFLNFFSCTIANGGNTLGYKNTCPPPISYFKWGDAYILFPAFAYAPADGRQMGGRVTIRCWFNS